MRFTSFYLKILIFKTNRNKSLFEVNYYLSNSCQLEYSQKFMLKFYQYLLRLLPMGPFQELFSQCFPSVPANKMILFIQHMGNRWEYSWSEVTGAAGVLETCGLPTWMKDWDNQWPGKPITCKIIHHVSPLKEDPQVRAH